MDYEILKNRLTNGAAFFKQVAIDRINKLADNLVITQEQADELLALAERNGSVDRREEAVSKLDALRALKPEYGKILKPSEIKELFEKIWEVIS